MFITLEGPEGSGKTTQAFRLRSYFEDLGRKVLLVREPGGTALGDHLRNVLLFSKDVAISSCAELLLFAAARAQLTCEVIHPYLESGAVVICDRYADSTVAYQSYGRGIGRDDVDAVNRVATANLIPDLTLLFDVPPEVGLARNRKGELTADRLELEDVDFHRRVRQGYLEMAKKEPQRWVVIDALQSVDQVTDRVRDAVAVRLR